jgi:hypothetical protein
LQQILNIAPSYRPLLHRNRYTTGTAKPTNEIIYTLVRTKDTFVCTIDTLLHTIVTFVYTKDTLVRTKDTLLYTIVTFVHTINTLVRTINTFVYTINTFVHTIYTPVHTKDTIMTKQVNFNLKNQ